MGCCTSTSSPRLSTRCKPVILAIMLLLYMYGVSLCFFMCMWVYVCMFEFTSARVCALVSVGVCWRVACLCLLCAGVQVNLCVRVCACSSQCLVIVVRWVSASDRYCNPSRSFRNPTNMAATAASGVPPVVTTSTSLFDKGMPLGLITLAMLGLQFKT